jgi:MYXO-CTERM domain-containing protein
MKYSLIMAGLLALGCAFAPQASMAQTTDETATTSPYATATPTLNPMATPGGVDQTTVSNTATSPGPWGLLGLLGLLGLIGLRGRTIT